MLINGQPAASLPLADRGLAYGDGLFETMRFHRRRLLFAGQHLARLVRGAERLGMCWDETRLTAELTHALTLSAQEDGILKLVLTRGCGGRGYRPPQQSATRIITLHALPDHGSEAAAGISAFLCRQRLGTQPALAGIKHLNRLEQVLASREWPDESFLEGLMLDQHDRVVEGTRSNVFVGRGGVLVTPALDNCGIDGVMREVLLQHFAGRASVQEVTLADLQAADELFFCNSVIGIWPVTSLQFGSDVQRWQQGPFAQEALAVFEQALLS